MKLLITLLIAFSSNIYASATSMSSTTPLENYFNTLSAMDDSDLVDHFEKAGSFGDCSFRKAAGTTSICKYTLMLKTGEKICITTSSHKLIGLVAPPTLPSSITTMYPTSQRKREYFNLLRNVTLKSDAIGRAADLIRDRFLTYAENSTNCSFSSSSVPAQIDRRLDQFTASNTSFYTSSTNNTKLFCKTAILSKTVWNHETCQYEQKDRYLSTKFCKTIYNRLSKIASISPTATAPAINIISSAQEVDFVKQQIAVDHPELVAATTKIPVEEVIPASTLYHIELTDPDNVTFSCSSSVCGQEVMNLKASIDSVSGISSFQAPQELNFTPPATFTQTGSIGSTAFISSLVNQQYQSKVSIINTTASNALIEHQLVTPFQINANAISCAPQIIAIAAPFPQVFSM